MKASLYLLLVPQLTSCLNIKPQIPFISRKDTARRLTNSYVPSIDRAKKDFDVDLAVRSAIAGTTCVTTWALASKTKLSIIQASCLHGAVASIASAAYSVPAFCGSFAGMSMQLRTGAQALQLGVLCALVYALFDAKKWQLGKGGRLGTISFCSNALQYCIRYSPGALLSALNVFPPLQTAMLLAASALMVDARRKKVIYERVYGQANNNSLIRKMVAQAMILVVTLHYFGGARRKPIQYLMKTVGPTFLAIWTSGITTYRLSSWRGSVLASSVVGLLGSWFVPKYAAQIFLGSFIGMTALDKFELENFALASVLAALLFVMRVVDGFGGRLGFLSFVGVNFGM